MLDIPEEIKNLFRADNLTLKTRKKFKLTFYEEEIETLYPYETLYPAEDLFPSEQEKAWLVIENDRIYSETLQITESLSSSEDMEFGSCEAAMFEVVVADVEDDLTGKEFTLTVEIGGYEMAMGIYTVDSFKRQADRRRHKIVAYDRMRKFNTDVSAWYNELVFPMTIKKFRDALCDYIGVEQEDYTMLFDGMQIEKTIEPEELSGLDILIAICQINGCFGHVNKTGKLGYIMLQETGLYPSEDLFPEETLYPSEFGGDGMPTEVVSTYKSLVYEDYLVEGITGLSIREQEGDIGANVGDGYNNYVIEGNFLVYGKSAVDLLNIAQSLLPHIEGRVYCPATLECVGMPWVEVGDAIIAPTRDNVVETFVMQRVTKGSQALTDTITSTGSQRREEVFGVNKKIIQLEGKSAVLRADVEQVSARVTDLKNYTEAEFKIQSDRITAEVTRATEEEGKLSGRIEVNAQQILLKVSKGQVSSEISVESGQVTLRGNRLVVDSTNFKLDASGNADFSGKITGGSININKVFTVDSSGNTNITGNHFTWSATNSSMTSDGTITCNNIKASNGQFAGRITGSIITSGSIDVGPFSVNDAIVEIGDYQVSIDGSNIFSSSDGTIYFEKTQTVNGYSRLVIGHKSASYKAIINCMNMTIDDIMMNRLKDDWGAPWQSVGYNIEELWDRIADLSDETIKDNIISIDADEALKFLLNHNPVTFQYEKDGKWSAGFLAQEVEALEDELEIYYPIVSLDRRYDKYAIKYTNYIPLLVSAVQNLQNQINELKGEMAS